jgi:hypothetical protein
MEPVKVVARFRDGRVMKGHTADFIPTKSTFHLTVVDSVEHKPIAVQHAELKAVFFVKDFKGNPGYNDRKEFDSGKPTAGRKIRVVFKDGETMVGTTQGYQQGRPSFFLIPADPQSNIDRCFIVSSATKEITFM